MNAFTIWLGVSYIYRQESTKTLRVVTQAVPLFDVPKFMVTDKGCMFESTEIVSYRRIWVRSPLLNAKDASRQRPGWKVYRDYSQYASYRYQSHSSWSDILWKLYLVLNIAKQKTTQASPLNLMIGTEATTSVTRLGAWSLTEKSFVRAPEVDLVICSMIIIKLSKLRSCESKRGDKFYINDIIYC